MRGWRRRVAGSCCAVAARKAASDWPSDLAALRTIDTAALSGSKERLSFDQRLHRKADFDAVYREGRRSVDGLFAIVARRNSLGYARLGLSVGARAVGNAVSRNRVKRLARESFRLQQHSLPSIDIVVNARHGARHGDNANLRRSLERHWRAISQQCERS